MRRSLLVLLLALALCPAGVLADEKEAEEKPPKPLTTEQAADAVLKAFKANDQTALKALAEKDDPDPWLVADELCFRGAHEAAETYARAAARQAVAKLAAYVASRNGLAPDESARATLASLKAVPKEDLKRLLERAESFPRPLDSVCRIRIAVAHGMVLRRARRLEESAKVLKVAAEAALEIGWLTQAFDALFESGQSAAWHSDLQQALSAWTACLELAQALDAKARVARALGGIGVMHAQTGDFRQALLCQERALGLVTELGNRGGEAQTLGRIGSIHFATGDYARALSYQQRALAMLKELGLRADMAATLGNLGIVHANLGDYAEALSCMERALRLKEELGERSGAAATLANIGHLHTLQGNYVEALSYAERAFRIQEEIGDRAGMAKTLAGTGPIHSSLGDHPKALSCLERALGLMEKLGYRPGVALTLGNIGLVHSALGDYHKALSYQERALAMQEASGNRAGVARALMNVGNHYASLGDYPKALSCLERSLGMYEASGDRASMAGALASIGQVHLWLGDFGRALSFLERALRLQQEIGARAGVGMTLVSIGHAHQSLGDYATALSFHERALRVHEEVGARARAATALASIGIVHQWLGNHAAALSYQERALGIMEELGERGGMAAMLGNIGTIHHQLEDYGKALAYLERAIDAAQQIRATPVVALWFRVMAGVRLDNGEAGLALRTAQRGLDAIGPLLGGLGDEEGATARAQHASLFAVGTLAARRLEDVAEALRFLESGRSGALLESLGAGSAARYADLPKHLVQAEAEVQAREARARYDYRRALDSGQLREAQRMAKALDQALERVREVAARIQREAKRVAGLFYPRAASLARVQRGLGAGQALVLYGLCRDDALALVLTPGDARFVTLGTVADVERVCRTAESLIAGSEDGQALPSTDDDAGPLDAERSLAGLREALVAPLSLGDEVKTVLVSPEGALCYVPFGVLFGDRAVAITPSGTTHLLLQDEDRGPGDGVLALGDPDYGEVDPDAAAVYVRSGSLSALPATREEAKAVGDVVLLGAEANEAKLREALLQRKRWRAVHFACHGLVDPERPTLSSLALSGGRGEDGFLTALEVLRMKIPADLAVLSACETGKGKVVKGEGIVGLTRAFMYAGAPRVLCSLWKVDDEATRALMIKFYESWSPKDGKGLGAAAALKTAQEYVRDHPDHPKWKHPYYWAAWVLWGLPE